MRARDLMSALPAHIGTQAAIPDAARRIRSLQVRHLPVVDPNDLLVGMVFDHDLFRRGGYLGDVWVWFEDDDAALTIGDVAHPVDVVVSPDDALPEVLKRIAASPQDCAVATDGDGCPVGILTEHDALRIAADVVPAHVLARDVATTDVVTVRAMESGPAAWRCIADRGIRHLPVVDDEGGLVGVVSMRDLIEDDAAHRPEIRVRDIVRGAVQSAPSDASLRTLAERMVDARIGCLPLVDEREQMVGLITRRDVLDAAVAALQSTS